MSDPLDDDATPEVDPAQTDPAALEPDGPDPDPGDDGAMPEGEGISTATRHFSAKGAGGDPKVEITVAISHRGDFPQDMIHQLLHEVFDEAHDVFADDEPPLGIDRDPITPDSGT